MSFKDKPVFTEHQVKGRAAIPVIKSKCPGVFMCFARSNNGNVVTYELTPDNKVDAYWLLAEPSYGESWRKRHGHDREELSVIESSQAYGVTTTPGKKANQLHVVVKSVPRRSILVTKTKTGKAVGLMKIDGKQCVIDYVWVETAGIRGAKWVELHGYDPKTKTRHSERLSQ